MRVRLDPQFVAVEPDRERAVVDQVNLHVRPEATLRNLEPVAREDLAEDLVEPLADDRPGGADE